MNQDDKETSRRFKYDEWKRKGFPTITSDWKLPISHVVSVVFICVYGTILWSNLKSDNKDNHRDMQEIRNSFVSEKQARHWIDEANKTQPVKLPSLPEKPDFSGDSVIASNNLVYWFPKRPRVKND